jgi:WD40 repeat protein
MSAIFISHSSKDNAVAAEVKAKLLEQGHRSIFLDFDPENGIPAGRNWEKELYLRLRACQAVIVVCSENYMASPWCFAEITQARSLGKHLFPLKLTGCRIPSLLSDVQVTDLTENPAEGYQRLWSGLKKVGLDPMDLFDWDGSRPPYPGLLAFQEQDAALYFGRNDAIQGTLESLNRLQRLGGPRLVLVLGASGSGKSSLVRAGVAPRLKRDKDRWLLLEPFRPLGRPFDEFAVVLANAFASFGAASDWKAIRGALNSAATAASGEFLMDLANDLRIAAERREATVLVVIDQLEELLGRNVDRSAALFFRLLSAVLNQPGCPFIVVATLRSDFLGAFQSHEAILKLAYEPLPLPPMALADFAQVIEGPAKVAGVELEAGLAQAMIADTATDDALPLLAFTLRELWDRYSQDGRLTVDDYRNRLGGLQGSLARAAEAIYSGPPAAPDDELQLRTAFLTMVRLDEEGRYVRRPALWKELPEGVHDLLERFVQARLLVSGSDGGERIVEVAHEALFRSWDRLVGWLNADREFLLWRQRLRGDIAEWERTARDESMLLRGPVLAEAERWLGERADGLNPAEREFITASLALRQREREARERASRRTRLAVTAVIVFVSLVAAFAAMQWWRAEEQGNFAEAQGLAAQAGLVFRENDTYLERSALLAIESMSRVPLPENDTVLRQATSLLPRSTATFRFDYPINSVAFSPDGRRIVTAGASANAKGTVVTGKYVRVIEAMTGKNIISLDFDQNEDGGETAAFSPDGRYIITGSRIFEATSGKEVDRLNHDGRLAKATLSYDGRYVLLSATPDGDLKSGVLRVFEAMTSKEVAQLSPADSLNRAALSSNGRYMLIPNDGNGGAAMRVLDVTTGKELGRLGAGTSNRVALGPDGKYAVFTTTQDGSARVYEVATGKEVSRLDQDSPVYTLTFNPDGRYVVTGNFDNTVRLFEVMSGTEVARFTHGGLVSMVTFSPNGQYVLTGSSDQTVRIFEPVIRDVYRIHHKAPVHAVTLSPDGRYMSSDSGDPTVGLPATARVFEMSTGKEMYSLVDQDALAFLAFSPDGRYALIGNRIDNAARVIEVTTQNQIARIGDDNDGYVTLAAFSPDARHVAIWTTLGGYARVFEVATGKEIATLEHAAPLVSAIAFSPDARHILLGMDQLDDESAVEAAMFDALTGKEVTKLSHAVGVEAIAFSVKGQYVATGGRDGSAFVFAVPEAKEIARLNHARPVQAIAFSPDDRYVGTATDDGTVRVFEANTGKEVSRLNGEGEVRALMFGADGKYLYTISGGQDLTFRRHLLASKDLIDEACSRLTRNLTLEEWNQYISGTAYRKTCTALPDQ